MAAQNNVYQGENNNMKRNSKSVLCGDRNETGKHIIYKWSQIV